ncbi:nuclear transport factor 2 family protein [Lysobacter sp. K5869]|uniref:nuclear transport factor 2 family protein n=1 Tax=Lysobacter sp. K5869 TaxID=2820808 RepID=UPI001C062901|nr:nuclear transport factor 2 family protein [Lysobacter sp. K5869]QWP76783.1 nuclear transport factor 2 family protein [Lysobacter sp. K5869]
MHAALAVSLLAGSIAGALAPSPAAASEAADRAALEALDIRYQAAVKANDAATMAAILHEDFVLVSGRGQISDKAALLEEARAGRTVYERQDASERSVRVWGDTGVVTAKLWLKGRTDGEPFDYKLWYSDTYARTPRGWRYVLGQASLRLPDPP